MDGIRNEVSNATDMVESAVGGGAAEAPASALVASSGIEAVNTAAADAWCGADDCSFGRARVGEIMTL